MSESQAGVNSVLLPTARVSLFVRDGDIRAAAAALRDDWRFARVTFDIIDGDVDVAIGQYSQHASPDLVMVETQEVTDTFSSRLEILAGSCGENTAAVVVGPTNDVYLYRKLIDMGVSDYLVRPLSQVVLADVIAKILIERLGAPGSALLAYVGSKGGVGTSTLAQVSAHAIAHELNQKTIILDVATGWSYLSVAMGSEATTTLHEVARASVSSDQDAFKRMIVNVDDKLSFLATGIEPLLDDVETAEHIELILSRLMQSYPVVIIDLSRAPASIMRAVFARANEIVVVATPSLPSLRAARGLLQETKTLRGGVENGLHLVVNMKGFFGGQDISDGDIQAAIKMKPQLTLPLAPKVFGMAETQGKSIEQIPGGKDVYQIILKFIQDNLSVSGEARTDTKTASGTPNKLGGLLGKLKAK